jgi:hypothetical protein
VAEELRTAGEVTGIAPCLAVARPGQRRPFARSSAAMELAEALVDGVENLLAQVGKVALQDLVETSWLNSASSANAVGVRAAAGVELEVLDNRQSHDFGSRHTKGARQGIEIINNKLRQRNRLAEKLLMHGSP